MNRVAMELSVKFRGTFPDLNVLHLASLLKARSIGLGAEENLDTMSQEMAQIIEEDFTKLGEQEIVDLIIGSTEIGDACQKNISHAREKMYKHLM